LKSNEKVGKFPELLALKDFFANKKLKKNENIIL
jgi:hypothetical protein